MSGSIQSVGGSSRRAGELAPRQSSSVAAAARAIERAIERSIVVRS
ncbi:MAG TPA: hypothetical protein VFS59_04705 [Gemmatimonadaceae bacterium]|nr:hypothetical protein [Gemmatimonadaceae bacterium]